LGGKQATEITGPDAAKDEVARGLRVRSSPQGITGTNYLEMDYVEPPPPLLPIDWIPDNVYIPSTPSTVTALVNAASDIMDRLHKLDVEGMLANFNRLMITTNAKIEAIDSEGISKRTEQVLAKLERRLDELDAKKLSDQGVALLSELRESNAELKKTLANPAWQKLPDEALAAVTRVRTIVDDPALTASVANFSRSLARIDRILGIGESDLNVTFNNLRQITDNLRDLTEDAKRYPSNVFFGRPPPPPEGVK
jgi:ABC-type transporter Mla subunit MlaD